MPIYTGKPPTDPQSTFSTSLTGTCLCTAIKVTITDSELFTRPRGHLCHCANCRKTAGSYVSANLNIEAEKVRIEDPKGVKRVYEDMGGSGKIVHRHFCGVCGNPICSIADAYPGRIIVKMGMMPRIPEPEWEAVGEHRHEWQGKHPGMKIYKFAPTGELLDDGKGE